MTRTPEQENRDIAIYHYREFMRHVGLDVNAAHSVDTPRRVTDMFLKDFGSHEKSSLPEEFLTVFPTSSDQYVCVRDIPYSSLCKHHHLPFWGKVDIVYHPDGKLLGLSKFARIVNFIASRPSIQEDFTEELSARLAHATAPKGLYIRVSGLHSCMMSRGIKTYGETITTAIYGDLNIPEALEMIKKH